MEKRQYIAANPDPSTPTFVYLDPPMLYLLDKMEKGMAQIMRALGKSKMHEGGNMSSITVKMKNGTTREFPHEGRAGGSYTKTLYYQGAFAVIEDEYGRRVSIPASDIEEIVETPTSGAW